MAALGYGPAPDFTNYGPDMSDMPTATPMDWSKVATALKSLGGVGAPGGVGGSPGGGYGTSDANYLRIGNPGQAFSPGMPPTLLATLLQMHNAALAAQQPQYGAPRASLLG
jgi:hypothetical protein